jgi:hypothetical protein
MDGELGERMPGSVLDVGWEWNWNVVEMGEWKAGTNGGPATAIFL